MDNRSDSSESEKNVLDPSNHDDDCGIDFQSRKRLSVQVPVSSLMKEKSAKKVKKTVVTEDSGQLEDNDPLEIKNLLWEMVSHIEWRTEKNINSLPDLVLRKIFSKFTNLNEKLVLGNVCPYWKSFQDEITFKMSHLIILICPTESVNKAKIMGKFSKTLRVEDADDEENDSNVLEKFSPTLLQYEEYIGSKTIDTIVDAMPNITSLTIVLDHCMVAYVLDPVIYLLLRYNKVSTGSPITNFHFYARNFRDHPSKLAHVILPDMQHKLFRAFDTLLPGLERFTWDIDKAAYREAKKLGYPYERVWPFVSRLRELNFYSPDNSACLNCCPLFDSLNRFASPERLERIGLNVNFSLRRCDLSPVYTSFTKLDTRFYSKVTITTDLRINILISLKDIPRLVKFVTDFSGLTRLRINVESDDLLPLLDGPFRALNVAQVLHSLSSLHRLVRLDLCVPDLGYGSVLQGDAHYPVDSIVPFKTVKTFHLYCERDSHLDIYSPHWGRIFPSVQTFELIHSCDRHHILLNGSTVGKDIERGNKELLRMFAEQFPLVTKLFVVRELRTVAI